MLGLPKSTELKRQLSKGAIYSQFNMNTLTKEKFDDDIKKITIVNEVSPKTTSISEGEKVDSFFVLHIILKKIDFDEKNIVLISKLIKQNNTSLALYNEITNLNRQVISTKPAIDGINNILRDSGFQGFCLREKSGQQNIYEVIRSDGSVACNLSEGERNFIAFLYFYHLVRGSFSDSDIGKERLL